MRVAQLVLLLVVVVEATQVHSVSGPCAATPGVSDSAHVTQGFKP